jgi:hypothetical protein
VSTGGPAGRLIGFLAARFFRISSGSRSVVGNTARSVPPQNPMK